MHAKSGHFKFIEIWCVYGRCAHITHINMVMHVCACVCFDLFVFTVVWLISPFRPEQLRRSVWLSDSGGMWWVLTYMRIYVCFSVHVCMCVCAMKVSKCWISQPSHKSSEWLCVCVLFFRMSFHTVDFPCAIVAMLICKAINWLDRFSTYAGAVLCNRCCYRGKSRLSCCRLGDVTERARTLLLQRCCCV